MKLQQALRRWLGCCSFARRLERGRLSAAATTCAVLCLRVACVDDERSWAFRLAELLRVIELLRHPSLSPTAFQQLLRDSDGGSHCPFQSWCSFCDGGRRDVELRLDWGGSLQAMETALFEWTEDTMATTDFRRLRRAVDEAMAASSIHNDALEPHVPPVEASLCFFGDDDWTHADQLCRVLQERLEQQAPVPRFRVSYRPPDDKEPKDLALHGPAGIPVRVDDWRRDWEWVLSPRTSLEGGDWNASAAVLATANIISLHAHIETQESAHKLHEILRSQPTALQTLTLEYGPFWVSSGRCIDLDAHNRLYCEMVDALFSSRRSDSTLKEFALKGRLTQHDLVAMVAHLASTAVPSLVAGNRLTQFTCSQWDWAEMRGATLAELLGAIGGVDSLRLERKNTLKYVSSVPMDELPDLVRGCQSLRCLDADVVCETPVMIPQKWDDPQPRVHVNSLDHDLSSEEPVETTSLERLCLRPIDRNVAVVQQSIVRLLQRVGRSLVSLSLVPHRGRVNLNSDMANAIVKLCPKLQELKVTSFDVSFVQALVHALGTSGDATCQLTRLDLGSHDADAATFAPLFAALRVSTHPLTRSLSVLRLDIADSVDIERVASTARDVLTTNRRLTRLIVSVESNSVETELDTREASADSTVALQFPPLRHRLAILSVIRTQQLPREVTMRVLELVSHRLCRLSIIENSELMYHYDDSDQEY